MNKLRLGLIFIVLGLVDTAMVHYTMYLDRRSPLAWVFSLLLPILFFVGILLVGRGLGERKEVVYDYRHSQAPDSERNVR